MATYYQVLELSEQATEKEIRQAYLRLVRLTHPDRTPDPAAHARYLLVNEAYDTLIQPERRARYDASLIADRYLRPQPALRPFEGNAYQVLRVPYSATPAQIEVAYQYWTKMLRQNQIDPALKRLLADVEHAYATLCEPTLRRLHHEHLRRWQPPPRRASPYAEQYARYGPYARIICRILLVIGLLVVLDSVLTRDFPREYVESTERKFVYGRGGNVDRLYYWVETPHAAFRAPADLKLGTPLHIRRSAIFRLVRTYQLADSPTAPVVNYSAEKLYGAILFFPWLLVVMAAIGAWPNSPDKRAVDSVVPAFGLALLVAYLLINF